MRQKEEKLIYEPIAGLTVLGAFTEAVQMAKKAGKPVHAIVNDIEMDVTAQTHPTQAVATFQKKLKEHYEAEMRAQKRQKSL